MDIGINGNIAASASSASTVQARQPSPVAQPVEQVMAQTEAAVPQAGKVVSAEQLKQAVQEINSKMESLSRGLQFSVDEGSEQPIVKVIDRQTEEVIRQIPTEEALAIAESLDRMLGQLIEEKA